MLSPHSCEEEGCLQHAETTETTSLSLHLLLCSHCCLLPRQYDMQTGTHNTPALVIAATERKSLERVNCTPSATHTAPTRRKSPTISRDCSRESHSPLSVCYSEQTVVSRVATTVFSRHHLFALFPLPLQPLFRRKRCGLSRLRDSRVRVIHRGNMRSQTENSLPGPATWDRPATNDTPETEGVRVES